MTSSEAAEQFLRRFLDTYEAHDLDELWTFYSHDCRFPVLERFGIDPSWAYSIPSSRCTASPTA